MSGIANIAVVGLIFGMIGTTVGGVAGAFLDINSNKFVSFILEIAAGLMTSVICFNLIPESMEYWNITGAILGMFIGVCMMLFCNDFVNNRLFRKSISFATLEINTKEYALTSTACKYPSLDVYTKSLCNWKMKNKCIKANTGVCGYKSRSSLL